jgi:hypothetical protein
MKIGKPVGRVPPVVRLYNPHYEALWRQVRALVNGEALPVEFDTRAEVHLFNQAARRTGDIQSVVRGNTLYLSKKGGGD